MSEILTEMRSAGPTEAWTAPVLRSLADEIGEAHEAEVASAFRGFMEDCDEELGTDFFSRASTHAMESHQRNQMRSEAVRRLEGLAPNGETVSCEMVEDALVGDDWIGFGDLIGRLIWLLGGERPTDGHGCGCADGSATCACKAAEASQSVPHDELPPITQELRCAVAESPEDDVCYVVEKLEFDRLCDQIDAIDANLQAELFEARLGDAGAILDAIASIDRRRGTIRSLTNELAALRWSRDHWRAERKAAERDLAKADAELDDAYALIGDAFDEWDAAVRDRDEWHARYDAATIPCDAVATTDDADVVSAIGGAIARFVRGLR